MVIQRERTEERGDDETERGLVFVTQEKLALTLLSEMQLQK